MAPIPVPPFDQPGRGAWRLTGGLLPARPGSTSRVGYYRLAVPPAEAPAGAAFVRTRDPERTYGTLAVNLGVRTLQRLCGLTAGDVDGWFGPGTDTAVRAAQARGRVAVDGIVGPATMRALIAPLLAQHGGTYGVPVEILGGVAVLESALDPGAVGVNGSDSGIVQINRAASAHPEVGVADAFDASFALQWAAQQLRAAHDQWDGDTLADPWDIAIASHNSPVLAAQWARANHPPYLPGRVVQIEDYVIRVRTAWAP